MIQKLTSLLMLSALTFAGIAALTSQSRAQSFRDEFEKTGLVPALVSQNSRTLDIHERDIADLKRRAEYQENLHLETRMAMVEKFVTTSEENQKLLWGMLVTLVFFVMKEIYVAFFKARTKTT